MSVDDIAKRFGERLDRQVAASDDRLGEAVAGLQTAFRRADEEARRADARTRERIARSLGSHDRRVIVDAQVTLGNDAVLQQVDGLLWQAFALGSVCEDSPLRVYPVVYCETLEEFYSAILASQDLSETIRKALLAQEVAEAQARAEEGEVILGVNLPGQGCYINGWFFGLKSEQAPHAALQDAATFPRIFSTVCHEKLGHGFISAFTAMGREKTQLGLWRHELAERFSLRTADSPQGMLLLKKHALIHHTSILTEEGWATWIAQAMVRLAASNGLLAERRASGASRADAYTLEALGELLTDLQAHTEGEARRVADAFVKALQVLLIDDEVADASAIFWAVRTVRTMAGALDDLFSAKFGQPTAYVLGYLMLQRLERRIGWENVPYAVMIAGNVVYDLETTALTDLESALASDPGLNVDVRLALLGRLALGKGEGHRALAQQARELLNFAVPEGW